MKSPRTRSAKPGSARALRGYWRGLELDGLFVAAWDGRSKGDYGPVLRRSLVYVCAYVKERLIGFVNVAWDGGVYAFLLDTSVHPDHRHRGIGREFVRRAAGAAGEHDIEWLHVDFDPHLRHFYAGCGFRSTEAGLLRLDPAPRV